MRNKLIGVFTAVALMGAGAAVAGGDKQKTEASMSPQDSVDTSSTMREDSALGGDSSAVGGAGSTEQSSDQDLGSTYGGSGTSGAGQTGAAGVGSTTGSNAAGSSSTGRATGTTGGATSETAGGAGAAAGSTSTGATATAAGESELTGRVVRSDGRTIYVDHMGAVVPLKIDASTKFQGQTLTRAKDIKEGQEVRASFEVQKKTTNVAKTIELATEGGTGGTGSDLGGGSTGTGAGSGGTSGGGTGGSGLDTGSDLGGPGLGTGSDLGGADNDSSGGTGGSGATGWEGSEMGTGSDTNAPADLERSPGSSTPGTSSGSESSTTPTY